MAVGFHGHGVHGFTVEVFFIGNKVGNRCFLSKRRTVDLRRGICVFACLHSDELALLRGNDDVFQGINSVVAAGGGDNAAGDGDIVESVDAVASRRIAPGFSSGRFYCARTDGDSAVGFDAVAVSIIRTRGRAAGGSDRTADYGNLVIGVNAVAFGGIAPGFRRAAGGGDRAALYDDVKALTP